MTATDPSGLSTSTTYYFQVNSVEYSITTGSTTPTYEDVAQLMDSELQSVGFRAVIVGSAPSQDIRIYNDGTRGDGSTTNLDNGVTSPDLFTSLTDFTAFEQPVGGGGINSIEGLVATVNIYSLLLGGIPIVAIDDLVATQEVEAIILEGAPSYYPEIERIAAGSTSTSGSAEFVIQGDTIVVFASGSGRMILSNSAPIQVEYLRVADGLTVVAGGAQYTIELDYDSSGGLTVSGVTVVDVLEIDPSAGGIAIASGTVVIQVEIIETTSGGANLFGTPILELEIIRTTSGGADLTGDSILQVEIIRSASGSANMGGAAEFDINIIETTSGGITMSGVATTSVA